MVLPLPSNQQPMANVIGQSAYISVVWQRFFNSFLAAPAPPSAITVSSSPFSYTASAAGSVVLSGGTVSGRTLKRGQVTISIDSPTVPVARGDIVTVTYSVKPTMNFLPG